jgi:hypothetical protein
MHFEGSLTQAEENIREPLYQALHRIDEDEIHRIVEDEPAAQAVSSILIDGETPWTARAKRILRSSEPTLRKGARSLPEGEQLWEEFTSSLKNLVEEGDEVGIYNYSQCQPWKTFRQAYRTAIGDPAVVQGETRVGLKITPYSQ